MKNNKKNNAKTIYKFDTVKKVDLSKNAQAYITAQTAETNSTKKANNACKLWLDDIADINEVILVANYYIISDNKSKNVNDRGLSRNAVSLKEKFRVYLSEKTKKSLTVSKVNGAGFIKYVPKAKPVAETKPKTAKETAKKIAEEKQQKLTLKQMEEIIQKQFKQHEIKELICDLYKGLNEKNKSGFAEMLALVDMFE